MGCIVFEKRSTLYAVAGLYFCADFWTNCKMRFTVIIVIVNLVMMVTVSAAILVLSGTLFILFALFVPYLSFSLLFVHRKSFRKTWTSSRWRNIEWRRKWRY